MRAVALSDQLRQLAQLSSSTTTITSASVSSPRSPNQHRQPLDPRSPADRRGMRAAEAFHQPVVAPAAEHGALRAEAVGDEFERGVAVIVEPADERRQARPLHARRRRARWSPAEEVLRMVGQEIVDPAAHRRRTPGRADPCCRGFATDCARAVPGCLRTSRPGPTGNRRPAPRARHRGCRRRPGC